MKLTRQRFYDISMNYAHHRTDKLWCYMCLGFIDLYRILLLGFRMNFSLLTLPSFFNTSWFVLGSEGQPKDYILNSLMPWLRILQFLKETSFLRKTSQGSMILQPSFLSSSPISAHCSPCVWQGDRWHRELGAVLSCFFSWSVSLYFLALLLQCGLLQQPAVSP